MSKGEETKERLLHQAAELFNKQGYSGSSLSDVMRATGLQKGGVYNHFESKEKLALEAFDYAADLVRKRFAQALEGKSNAIDRLLALVSVFRTYVNNPPVPGGCPVMNTAIECDDSNPALLERAQKAMDEMRGTIHRIVSKGIAKAEVRPNVDGDRVATLLIATFEGGLMLSKLYRDSVHARRIADYLVDYIEAEVKA
jgi:TetR/AcrR family transcriptional repressor of nem operon